LLFDESRILSGISKYSAVDGDVGCAACLRVFSAGVDVEWFKPPVLVERGVVVVYEMLGSCRGLVTEVDEGLGALRTLG
jgi:hypothetical protein